MNEIDIGLAERDWRRSFAKGVRKSLAKTVTEPATNAYDSYKRIDDLGIPENTGLVEAVLSLKTGDKLDQAQLTTHLRSAPERIIRIRLSTIGSGDLPKRECQIIDNAEGFDYESMQTKLRYRGADVGGQAHGAAVRGLFGHGLGDVLFGHDEGEIHSIVNNMYYRAKAIWKGDEQRQPKLQPSPERPVVLADRRRLRMPEGNGTMIRFRLHDECTISREETLYRKFCNFYMLRLINADPTCRVLLEEHRSGRLIEKELRYQLPQGEVVAKFQQEMKIGCFSIGVDAIMLRATTELPGRHSGEDRASGLLVVDECDVVYDQTMFAFDNDANIEHLYGIVRLTGVRPLIKQYLDERHEALLTDSRDGLETRGILYQQLAPVLAPWIRQQVEREQKRRRGEERCLSADMAERVKEAFKELNDLYKEETGENIDIPGPGSDPKVPDGIAFSEKEIVLRQGRPRQIYVLINPRHIAVGAQVILECPSSEIRIDPEDVTFDRDHIREDRIGMIPILLSSDVLGATDRITACAESRDGHVFEAFAEVIDTVPPQTVLPPADGMEFRPDEVRVKPHVRRSLQLWIDTDVIPIRTDIVVRLYDCTEGLWFLGDHEQQYTVRNVRPHEHDRHSSNPRVARILIPFRGTGYGQSGRVVATTSVDRRSFQSSAQINIEEHEPPSGAGIFNDIDYDGSSRPLACIFEGRASGKLIVNSRHPLNKSIFGKDRVEFRESAGNNVEAQMRLAEVVLDECIYHIAATKYGKSGEQGLTLRQDPITDIRNFIEEKKFKIGPKIYRHFAPSL